MRVEEGAVLETVDREALTVVDVAAVRVLDVGTIGPIVVVALELDELDE